MIKRKSQQLTKKEIENLLFQQTVVILNAVDDKLRKMDAKISQQTVVILSTVDEKLKRMELRLNQKIDRLTTTLDKFLKRLTNIEEEFEIMKADVN